MQLARVFQNYMVLQRHVPICIWGYSECEQLIEIKINGIYICEEKIEAGEFKFLLPAQDAREDITLEIGSIRLEHVDIGEVWVAGGQSNMEYMLRYEEKSEEEILSANDQHLRTYIVGQYSFPGERDEEYKKQNPWDRWLTYNTENAPILPAIAVHFAKEIRKKGVPVGILSCNWGGTSASAWTDYKSLQEDDDLSTYISDFDAIVKQIDMRKFFENQKLLQQILNSEDACKFTKWIMEATYHPDEQNAHIVEWLEHILRTLKSKGIELNQEDIYAIGPGNQNEPAALYENMLLEIAGYSVSGVIWYQGETDEYKVNLYAKLFSTMISCWRKTWKNKNQKQTRIPFLFVQLAPYGMWIAPSGIVQVSDRYPGLRYQQQLVEDTVQDVYMTSVSDIGNVYDIHPKVKKPIGQRLALLARKYVYEEEGILADAPRADDMVVIDDILYIHFKYGNGLYLVDRDFTQYNSFSVQDIYTNLIPPVLGNVNGLQVFVDGIAIESANCLTKDEQLVIKARELKAAKEIKVTFACTPFYQVNLYNSSNIPARPFELVYKVDKLH